MIRGHTFLQLWPAVRDIVYLGYPTLFGYSVGLYVAAHLGYYKYKHSIRKKTRNKLLLYQVQAMTIQQDKQKHKVKHGIIPEH